MEFIADFLKGVVVWYGVFFYLKLRANPPALLRKVKRAGALSYLVGVIVNFPDPDQ